MKKTTLLLCLFMASVMMPQSVWADAVLSNEGKTITITTTASGQVSSMVSPLTSDQKAAINKIVLDGKFTSSDLEAIQSGSGFGSVTEVDMSAAQFVYSTNGSIKLFSTDPIRTNSSNNNLGDFSMVGVLYKSGKIKEWSDANNVEYIANQSFTDVTFTEEDRNNHTNYNNNTYIRFPQGNILYYILREKYAWTENYNLTDDQKNSAVEYNSYEELPPDNSANIGVIKVPAPWGQGQFLYYTYVQTK